MTLYKSNETQNKFVLGGVRKMQRRVFIKCRFASGVEQHSQLADLSKSKQLAGKSWAHRRTARCVKPKSLPNATILANGCPETDRAEKNFLFCSAVKLYCVPVVVD